MTLKHTAVTIIVLGTLVALSGHASAGPRRVRRARLKHADRNKDGTVTAYELQKEKQWERKKKAQVNTPWEAKADTDNDGVVERGEAHKAKTAAYIKNRSEVDRAWEAKADTDGDGRVSVKELRNHRHTIMDKNGDGTVDATERKAYWTTRRFIVNTAIEKKYDTNGNGYVDSDEAKELLKDRLRIINTNGRAKVNTALEREYDANNDGVIDKDEAAAIRDALGLN